LEVQIPEPTLDLRLDRVANPLNREKRGHSVLLSWCKIDRSIQDIAGLDAEKLPPFAFAQV
jgi:hypothetical protein